MLKKKILIVEDESIIAIDIKNCLIGLGYEVVGISSTGEDAITKAIELKPNLILMDIHLDSELDGVETADKIRTLLDIPIIYLTAHADENTFQRAKITEPYGYILKPFEERLLHITVETSLYKHETSKELMELKEINLRNEYLVSLGSMIAAIGHEINQPLNTISLLNNGLLYWHQRNQKFDQDEVLNVLKRVSEQVERITKIIQKIRTFVRPPDKREMTRVVINDVIKSSLTFFQSQLNSHNVILDLQLSDDLRYISGDPIRLEQMIANMLTNSIYALDKANRPDKSISIITTNDKNLRNVRLKIIDNGVGIPNEILDKIFNPFFSTKDVSIGMGIGLTICKSVVLEHQGKIKAENNNDGGAIFTIDIPTDISSL